MFDHDPDITSETLANYTPYTQHALVMAEGGLADSLSEPNTEYPALQGKYANEVDIKFVVERLCLAGECQDWALSKREFSTFTASSGPIIIL